MKFGINLRWEHFEDIQSFPKEEGLFFEVMVDNLIDQPALIEKTKSIADRYPIRFHGVGLSLASSEPLDREYLASVRSILHQFGNPHYSEHFAWSHFQGRSHHDLLPFPFHRDLIQPISQKISETQDYLEQNIALENTSRYVEFKDSHLTEWEFISEVLEQSDANLLLDICNLMVNLKNTETPISNVIEKVPFSRVTEIHLAGYEDKKEFYIDSHSRVPQDETLSFFQLLQSQIKAPCVLEWDEDLPNFSAFLELRKAIYELESSPNANEQEHFETRA